jgi:hypothetical protein
VDAEVAGGSAPAAAAAPLTRLVNGPRVPGRVLGSLRRAVIITAPTAAGPRMVSLVARSGSGVPNGVRLTGATGFEPQPVGAPALVGGGEIHVGDLHLRVVRWWPTRVQPITSERRAVAVLEQAARAGPLGVPAAPLAELAAALLAEPGEPGPATVRAAAALIGLGAGLTPGGDDVLSGLLIGLHATGRSGPARPFGARLLDSARKRTTALSADLLRLAARGDACLEVLAVLQALHQPPESRGPDGTGDRLRTELHRLLSVGHTSGADLTTGLALGLRYGMTEQHMVACGEVGRRLDGRAAEQPVAQQEAR